LSDAKELEKQNKLKYDKEQKNVKKKVETKNEILQREIAELKAKNEKMVNKGVQLTEL